MSLEHISKSMGKYRSNDLMSELSKIRKDIIQATNIDPVSIKKQHGQYIVRANNQYEALEIKNRYNNPRVKVII